MGGYPKNIKSIDPKKMIMVLDGDSQWQFFPATKSLSVWQAGDQVVIEKKEGRFSLYRAINKTRKDEEAGVVPINAPSDISKSKYGQAEEYTNLGVEIKIKDAVNERIWLVDGSKWDMYNPMLGVPGFWGIGDAVIVTRRFLESMSKIYEMQNVKTGITLIAVFLGYEQ